MSYFRDGWLGWIQVGIRDTGRAEWFEQVRLSYGREQATAGKEVRHRSLPLDIHGLEGRFGLLEH